MKGTGRPGGVVIVALLNLLTAALYLSALTPLDFIFESQLLQRIVPITTMNQTLVIAGLLGAAGIANLLAGVGLFFMKAWAWRLTILLTGLGLFIYLWVDFTRNPVSVRLAVYAAIAFYLNTQRVRDAFNPPAAEAIEQGAHK